MSKVTIDNVTKSYSRDTTIFTDLSLVFPDNEFIVILGPSGCGKTTLLRMIAGLEDFDKGRILIDETDVSNMKPEQRDIAMVFQNYALYPQKTVYQNMEFGLKMRKVPAEERAERIKNASEILGLDQLLDRYPKQLSGGQRQRVALGRALVRDPKLFLLDEPLSNLDAKLRIKMRSEIIQLYQRIGKTMIYVTHDQTEAMTMGTRILLMNEGLIQQYDVPEKLYDEPANIFVAQFIGSPQMNIVSEPVQDGKVKFGNITLNVPEGYQGDRIHIGLRAEDLQIADGEFYEVSHTENLGNEQLIYLYDDQGEEIVVRDYERTLLEPGQRVGLTLLDHKIHWFDHQTGERV